jgi:hypothetical protein
MNWIQEIKRKIKQRFCGHLGVIIAEIEENPSPCLFLRIDAKCSDCDKESQEILYRVTTSYKLKLAENVLFQRNIDKFPEFYERARQTDEMRPVKRKKPMS